MTPTKTAQATPKSKCLTVAILGNPNTGKSTIFNGLAGVNARIGNFPGVTVEKKVVRVTWGGQTVDLVDLPGTYSLSPRMIDEMLAVDVLLGRQSDIGQVDLVVCVVDASNLERNLYLVSQLLDVGLPLVVILNMWDVAQSRGITIDVAQLSQRLGVPVVTTMAHRRKGLDDARRAIVGAQEHKRTEAPALFPTEFYLERDKLAAKIRECHVDLASPYLLDRLILDVGGYVESRLLDGAAAELQDDISAVRQRLTEGGFRVPAGEARVRYAWVRELLDGIVAQPDHRVETTSDRIDRILTHRVIGLVLFGALMFCILQAIYRWAVPFMEVIQAAQAGVGSLVISVIPPGPLQSLLVNGVIAGVGGVLVFLPQIAFLFLFIATLEDCGYMSRAAFLMDKLMTKIGLSGKSFVPLMSSFACAIPGVMATRVIENHADRMVTILVAPLMSCSARLPVYLLLIGAFIPPVTYYGGWVSLHGLVLFAVSSIGVVVAIGVAWLLKKTMFQGETPPFVLELPSYRWPSPRMVLGRVYDRSKAFIVRAGTLIFFTTILVWAAGYFPGDHSQLYRIQSELQQPEDEPSDSLRRQALLTQEREIKGQLMAQSILGRTGKAIEPLVKPLGWDWKIGVGAIGSFPAREVLIATLGTIYSLGGDVDQQHQGLIGSMRAATWPDGRPVYNVPVALSIMVFFALCAQCSSTLMVIKRETNSWYWPLFTFTYMTALAYVGAFAVYQFAMLFV